MPAFGSALVDAVDDGSEGLVVVGDDGLRQTLLLPIDAQQTVRLDAWEADEAASGSPWSQSVFCVTFWPTLPA